MHHWTIKRAAVSYITTYFPPPALPSSLTYQATPTTQTPLLIAQQLLTHHSTLDCTHTTMSPLSVPKIFMAGGAVGFGYYLYMRQYWFPNPYKTQGVQNIEDRYSAGGANPTHTPAMASERGMDAIETAQGLLVTFSRKLDEQ